MYANYVRAGLFILVVGVSYWVGYGMADRTYKLRELATTNTRIEAQNAAIEAVRRESEAETKRREIQARGMAEKAFAARESKLRGQINALKSVHKPECNPTPDRVHDYNDSIRAANRLAEANRMFDVLSSPSLF